MLIEPAPDKWVLQFEDNLKQQSGWTLRRADEGKCRHGGMTGIMWCERPVVRSGRCILHAPKLTVEEKRTLNAEQLAEETAFEEAFRREFLSFANQSKAGRPSLHWDGIQFPDIPWNTPPWLEIITDSSFYCGLMVFHQPTRFEGIKFGWRPLFHTTVFRDEVSFANSEFQGGVLFDKAVFQGSARMGRIYNLHSVFASATFLGDVDFSWSQFGGDTVFGNSTFTGRVAFDKVRIEGNLSFRGDNSKVFMSDLSMRGATVSSTGELTFERTRLVNASFLHSTIDRVNFRGVEWNRESAGISRRALSRRMLVDELNLRADDKARADYEAVADSYRQLVIGAERKRDFELAEDFHIGEMEVRRLARGLYFQSRVLRRLSRHLNGYSLYRLLSCYGCSYWQAAGVLVLLLLVASSCFMLTGLTPTPEGLQAGLTRIEYRPSLDVGKQAPLSQVLRDFIHALNHTLLVTLLQRDRPYRPTGLLGQAFQSTMSILLTGQAALVLLAVRRRFRR